MPARVSLHSGGCLCGRVRYVVNGPLRDVVVCHCSRCRRTHGHVAAYSACAAKDLEVVDDATLQWYHADGRARGFCNHCGASIFWQAVDSPAVSIAAGTLDPPTGLKTIAQIHTEEPGDYYTQLGEGDAHPGGLPG